MTKKTKERLHINLTSDTRKYLKLLASNEGSESVVIERLLNESEIKGANFSDEVATIIYRKLSDKLKGMLIAVNENNKMLKTNERVLNYLLISNRVTMEDIEQAEMSGYLHPALRLAKDATKQDIKALQIIKANQRARKAGNVMDEKQ